MKIEVCENIGMEKLTRYLRAQNEFVEIEVMLDEDMWIAVADKIGLVTEAPSYEALVERVRLLAPELIRDNLGIIPDSEHPARLHFLHHALAF
jgi:hypothetical protein